MDKETFENIAHANYLDWIIGEEKAHKAFEAETGFDITALKCRIDKSTGYEQELIYRFILGATETYWSTPEDAEHIETYRITKEYLISKHNYERGIYL